jgi:hypothetical protein
MPGYVSMGHLAKSSPLFLSSNLIAHSLPLEIKRMRPVQAGSAKFQSAALQNYHNSYLMRGNGGVQY